MKKLTIILALFSLLMTSCQQDEAVSPVTKSEEIANLMKFMPLSERMTNLDMNSIAEFSVTRSGPPSVHCVFFRFKIARKKFNCKGGLGICDFVWFPDFYETAVDITETASLLESDVTENLYFDLLLENAPVSDATGKIPSLEIDEDLENTNTIGGTQYNILISQGSYTYNANIGEHGGYRIYITMI